MYYCDFPNSITTLYIIISSSEKISFQARGVLWKYESAFMVWRSVFLIQCLDHGFSLTVS